MKRIKQPTRGFEIVLEVPETPTEFNEKARECGIVGDDPAVDYMNSEAVYRSLLPKVWGKVLDDTVSLFGIERPEEDSGEKDDENNPIMTPISDSKFVPLLKKSVEKATIQAALQAAADEIGFDISRKSRAKKAAPVFQKKAENLIAKVKAGESTWDRIAENCAARGAVTTLTFDEQGNAVKEVLAKMLQEVAEADDLG